MNNIFYNKAIVKVIRYIRKDEKNFYTLYILIEEYKKIKNFNNNYKYIFNRKLYVNRDKLILIKRYKGEITYDKKYKNEK